MIARCLSDSAPGWIDRRPSATALAAALASLRDRDRKVVLLTAWEGLAAEAAAVLGCSPNAYAVRLHRARRRLATALHRAETRPPAAHDQRELHP